ncbi:SDR family oxidoreductase [Roseibium sp. FZY0029]|uniref:SDR family oxidoreductase n=1 Tax=Roseibium sp. FZY0029 TaxID=3116647 RepID=UPI002EBBA15B|nr:SDR family oxidoreductase [Roseibium sp. FZY0029]
MTDQTTKPVAVVTGAAGDIGMAIAAKLSETHTIAAVDIDITALEGAAADLENHGAHIAAFQCDLTKQADLERLSKEAARLGEVTTLVNNAGAAAALTFHQMTAETLSKDLALNLEAALNCFKAFERSLIACGAGTVINIASVNGLSVFGHPAYSAAKAGLIHATRSIAVEYGKYGIRSNAIAPGTVKTQAWNARQAANPGVFAEVLAWYPFKSLPEPDDIAAAVSFLVGPAARCITGICLPVDSGLTAGSPSLPRSFTQSSDFDGF